MCRKSVLIDAVAEFWDNNAVNWKVAADLKTGTRDFCAELERYRFAKFGYLRRVIDYDAHHGHALKMWDAGWPQIFRGSWVAAVRSLASTSPKVGWTRPRRIANSAASTVGVSEGMAAA